MFGTKFVLFPASITYLCYMYLITTFKILVLEYRLIYPTSEFSYSLILVSTSAPTIRYRSGARINSLFHHFRAILSAVKPSVWFSVPIIWQHVLAACLRERAVAQHGPSQNSLTSEQQEKSAASTSAGAVSHFKFHSRLVFDTYLVVQFRLPLFVGEADCTPWYRTLTSWWSNQTLHYSAQPVRKSIKSEVCVWRDLRRREGSGNSWEKKSVFRLQTTAGHMLWPQESTQPCMFVHKQTCVCPFCPSESHAK